jgi:hypothetical protein
MVQFDFGQNSVLDLRKAQQLLRKCIISADSERILKIHLERPDYGVYWPYSRGVTGDANRATT